MPPAPVVRYGAHPDQVANLHLPAAESGPWPCVLLLHGGFWRERWDRTLMTPLAIDLAQRGFAAWNIEYRRVGQEGGGWPGTLDDVAAAADALADIADIDQSRLVAVGHSAGGHLSLWLGARTGGRVHPCAAVSQAGVADLAQAHADDLGSGAVADFIGGSPAELPDRYAEADPAARVPLGIRQLPRPRQRRRHRPPDPESCVCRPCQRGGRRRRAGRDRRRRPLRHRRSRARSMASSRSAPTAAHRHGMIHGCGRASISSSASPRKSERR